MLRFAIIEDDVHTNDKFKSYLTNLWSDCEVLQFYSFDSALPAIEKSDFDLIVSDLDLGPGSDKQGGIKIARVVDSMKCPLLIVSGAPQPELHRDIFKALGAWDYLQKPVVEADFATQVKRAVYFRKGQSDEEKDSFDDTATIPSLTINHRAKKPVTWIGEPIHLTLTELRLVEELVKHPNEAATFATLLTLVTSGTTLPNLRAHIRNIKNRFKDKDPSFDKIKSKAMVGYYWSV